MSQYTKYRLTVSYDGTDFRGWQEQSSVRTVQEELRHAASELFPDQPSIHGASRTDSGVHALGQVAHFRSETKRPPEHVVSGLNDYLPEDVTIIDARIADPDFQSHVDARGKTYVYVLMNRREPPSLFRRYMYWHPGTLAIERMQEAIQAYVGEHNYRGFATNAADEENPTCRIFHAELMKREPYFCFVITGNRFLYNMVRSMVGTLVDIGKDKSDPTVIPALFQSRNRANAGPVMPAKGLFLDQVYYDEPAPQSGDIQLPFPGFLTQG
jgi:tRNA pseudouridine38-40 synthase